MALGAERRDVLALILRQGAFLALAGAASGLALALGAGRLLASVLAGISPLDPPVLAVSTGLATLVAMAGALLPALRAAHVDPLQVMRVE
jgi:ABC-type antimicrobial peptide transport system permease subunit